MYLVSTNETEPQPPEDELFDAVEPQLIGERTVLRAPRLIGRLSLDDKSNPIYELLRAELKPWDGTEPITFTANQIIKISLSKRFYLLCNIAQHTGFAVADMHHFPGGNHTDRVYGAIVDHAFRAGLYSLRVQTSNGNEIYDPGLMPVEIGQIDFDS